MVSKLQQGQLWQMSEWWTTSPFLFLLNNQTSLGIERRFDYYPTIPITIISGTIFYTVDIQQFKWIFQRLSVLLGNRCLAGCWNICLQRYCTFVGIPLKL
jgi:hypothetical protein